MGDYVGWTTRCAEFGGDQFMGFLGRYAFLTIIFYIYLFSLPKPILSVRLSVCPSFRHIRVFCPDE